MTGIRGSIVSALARGPLEAPSTLSLRPTLGEALEIPEAGQAAH